MLLEQAFVEERVRRLHLRDRKGLLEAWAVAARIERGPRCSLRNAEGRRSRTERCALVAENAVRFALTDLAGAWRLAPSVRYQQSSAYVDGNDDTDVVNRLIRGLGAKRVDSGANLVLAVPKDPFVLYQSRAIDGIDVVSPLQLYLDLRKQPGRAEEAAQEILEREIMPTW